MAFFFSFELFLLVEKYNFTFCILSKTAKKQAILYKKEQPVLIYYTEEAFRFSGFWFRKEFSARLPGGAVGYRA